MAEVTCSLYDILMRMAEEVDDIKYYRITAVSTGGTQHIECGSQSAATANVFRYGVARVQGKGARQISAQGDAYGTATNAGGKFTLATALNSGAAVGETLDVAWHNEQNYGRAMAAVRAMFDESFPYWFREIIIDHDHLTGADGIEHTSVVFDRDQNEYDLQSDIAILAFIGVQMDSTNEEPRWIDPLDLWRAKGTDGGMRLRCYRGASGEYLPEEYHGKTLCLHYAGREPMPSTLTASTCQIPLEVAAKVAANIYKRRNLFHVDSELRTEGAAIPQLQAAAADAWTRMGYIRKPLKMGRKIGAF